MTDHRKVFNKGIDYFYNAISFSKNNKFGKIITVNIIALSTEYLLNSLLLKKGINSYETGLHNILLAVENNELIPDDIKIEAEKINQQCYLADKTNDDSKLDMFKLTNSLRSIKQWVELEIKPLFVTN